MAGPPEKTSGGLLIFAHVPVDVRHFRHMPRLSERLT